MNDDAARAVSLLLGASRRGGLLEAVRAAKLLAKTLDAPGGVDELLLAREKRMAVAANVDVQLRLRAARRERVTASAVNRAGVVTGMNLLFHESAPCLEACVAGHTKR